jgi:glutamine---fructose-6-phosphate transaminase (isomerizing)
MTITQPHVPPPVAERTKHPFLTHEMIFEIPEAIQRTIENSSTRVNSIAEKLNAKSHFYFTGCGTAFFSAMLGSNILSIADKLDFAAIQALELASHQPLAENSAMFGVSHSGITKTTVDALRAGKSKGSYTVAVTHFEQTPISKIADETLVVGNGPDKSRCHTKCYPAGAIALTTIGLDLLEQRHAVQDESAERIRREIPELPRLAKKVLASTEPGMKELAEKNAGRRTFYFAGTGGSYPNALEAALKIMETSYLPAQGFETEQLLHGPWVSLDNGSVVFVMATEERTHTRSVDLIKAATSLGSVVIPLICEGDREIDSIGKNTVQLPAVDEQLMPYLSIIPLYLFAYYTCLHRGYNPDYLRYLTPAYWDARTIIFPPGTH